MKKSLLIFITLVTFMSAKLHAVDESATTVLANIDFTVFTDGSESSPVSLYSSSVTSAAPGVNYASGVAAAGGSLYIKSSAYVELKEFSSLPSSGGTLRVTLEVKMKKQGDGIVSLQRGYSTDKEYVWTDEADWTTMTVMCAGYTNTSSSRMKISPYLSVNGFFLKSVKVEYNPGFLPAPEAYLPNDADGTQFTASCSRVTGATTYTADVYSLDEQGNPVYHVQGQALTALSVYSDPSAKITGLDPLKTYWYTVAAGNSAATSEPSEPVKVVISHATIDAPEALPAAHISSGSYTAAWTPVADAVSYVINTYAQQTLAENGEVAVFYEDFSGITHGTISAISYDGNLNDYTILPGWETDLSKAYAAGYFVLYPFSGPGVVKMPYLDLSESNGAFTLTVNAGVGSFGSFYSTDNKVVADLLDADGNTIETSDTLICSTKGFTDYKFNFTKGTDNCRLQISYTQVGNSEKFYIDEITITQTLAAGTVIEKQLTSDNAEGVTTAVIEAQLNEGSTYLYEVIAVGETVIGSGANAKIGYVQSKPSNRVSFSYSQSGIENIAAANETKAWRVAAGVLGVNGHNVAVHDINGRTLYRQNRNHQNESINLNHRGLVIVTVDNNASKIIL